jgi:hypothetical protein
LVWLIQGTQGPIRRIAPAEEKTKNFKLKIENWKQSMEYDLAQKTIEVHKIVNGLIKSCLILATCPLLLLLFDIL